MRKSNILVLIVIALGITGCTMGPKYNAPCVEMPSEWHSDPCTGMHTDYDECFVWWEALNDPTLNSLLERAACQNLDLSIAATRILESRMEYNGERTSNLFPHIDASASYGHVGYNKAILNQVLGRHNHQHGRGNIDFFEAGFDAEWEIDLFGMRKHELKALKAKSEASKEEFCNIWITLSADIVKNYVDLRGLQQRLKVLNENIKLQQETITLIDDLTNTGFTSTIDEKQAQEQLYVLEAQKPLISLGIHRSIHRLSVLLGYQPAELFCELSCEGVLPTLPCDKPIGIPSDLLRRRPDIRKAERDLAASTELVGSAVAAMFPRLSLKGFIGDISTLHAGSFTWFASPQLFLPVFNSKMLQRDVDISKVKVEQSLYEYHKTVLTALEEAENAIAALRFEMERNNHLQHAEKASQEAYELTLQLYQKGLKGYLDVLVADRSYLHSEDNYLQSQIEMLYNYIALYKALGGGWVCEDCEVCK